MKPAIRLRKKLDNGDLVTGLLVSMHIWPGLVEIAQQSGLDCLIVDQELGVCGVMNAPKLVEAEGRIRKATEKHGKSMWVIGDPEVSQSRGHTFLCIDEPIMQVKNSLSAAVEGCRRRVVGVANE